ncbi:MAG: hypothetical protein K5622_06160 [Endomicrobiaceae bacterium]|nr:hypothetical protein [Endomicrobiaceae bacterium]
MKKIIFSILLLAVCALPATARMNMDFIVKGGVLASPYLNLDKNITITDTYHEEERVLVHNNILDVDLGFTLGGEIFVYPWENIGLGLGAFHLFKTDVENTAKKISATNFYVAAKPKLILENKEIDSVYLIGQLGVSNADIKIIDASGLSGLYLAGGVGIEANWLIVEVLYSYYNWIIPDNDFASHGSMYSLQLNLGFKYSI